MEKTSLEGSFTIMLMFCHFLPTKILPVRYILKLLHLEKRIDKLTVYYTRDS